MHFLAENVTEIALSEKMAPLSIFLGSPTLHTPRLGGDAAKVQPVLAHNRGNVLTSGVDTKNSSNLGKNVRIVAILLLRAVD